MTIFLLGLAALVLAALLGLTHVPRAGLFLLMIAGALLVSVGTAEHQRCTSIGCEPVAVQHAR